MYKTKKQNLWEQSAMEAAVRAVIDGCMGYVKASESYHVPQTTLERRVKKCRETRITTSEASKKEKLGSKPVFTTEQEKELVNHILLMESRMFGLTIADVRRLAFQLAEKNRIKHPFSKKYEMAGKHWVSGLRKRHQEISLRTPEQTSLARVMGFNQVSVTSFFDLLESLYETYRFTPDKIFNVDETGVSTVPNKMLQVLGMKGKRQIGGVTSAERGTLTTVETCMSASGIFMPLMFVFPRSRINPELLDGAPSGSTAEFQSSGWMTADVFLRWFQRFIAFSNPTPENPVLLILDGHATHTKSLEFILKARENNVIVLCIPPHCSHRLQPLDISFMKPVSTYYAEAVSQWLRENPGRTVTIRQIAQLLGRAFIRAATMSTAINGFKKTGIWPFNRHVFSQNDFAPSQTRDRPLQPSASVQPEQEIIQTASTTSGKTKRLSPSPPIENQEDRPPDSQLSVTPMTVLTSSTDINGNHPQPPPLVWNGNQRQSTPSVSTGDQPQSTPSVSTGNQPQSTPSVSTGNQPQSTPSVPVVEQPTSSAFLQFSPSDVISIPHVVRPQTNRKRGRTAVLTASPYKRELEQAAAYKKQKQCKEIKKKGKKKLTASKKRNTKANDGKVAKFKKRLTFEKPSQSEDEIPHQKWMTAALFVMEPLSSMDQ